MVAWKKTIGTFDVLFPVFTEERLLNLLSEYLSTRAEIANAANYLLNLLVHAIFSRLFTLGKV